MFYLKYVEIFYTNANKKTIRNIQFALNFVVHIEPLSYGKSKFDKDCYKNLHNLINFNQNSKLYIFLHQFYVIK